MDSKIILAILIVALIGVVAATYQDQTADVVDTLANVATEDDVLDSLDTGDAGIDSSNSIEIDEGIVKPDTSTASSVSSKKVVSTSTGNSNKKVVKTTTVTTTKNNTTTTPQTQPTVKKITGKSAELTARSQLPDIYKSAKATITETTINNVPYYIVTFTQQDEIVAFYEIDAINNRITGGGIKNETPDPDDLNGTLI